MRLITRDYSKLELLQLGLPECDRNAHSSANAHQKHTMYVPYHPFLSVECTLFLCQAVLASIVWVALYGMFKQMADVWRYFLLSIPDMVRGLKLYEK